MSFKFVTFFYAQDNLNQTFFLCWRHEPRVCLSLVWTYIRSNKVETRMVLYPYYDRTWDIRSNITLFTRVFRRTSCFWLCNQCLFCQNFYLFELKMYLLSYEQESNDCTIYSINSEIVEYQESCWLISNHKSKNQSVHNYSTFDGKSEKNFL